ncbi:hypothetical protein [Methylobacterium aquaticum]|uniref:hypothetical protein n=1 Tax=Methylobacterium aquaticum TaxID=270351 RepID=UPI001931E8A7|nr:hypothetical protein [Methylobacterium aquaticum]QRE74270.1 hypothetical protein F1D61_12190 [Methylobacterium aquaticum]
MSEAAGREAGSIVLKTIGDDAPTEGPPTIGVATSVQGNYDPGRDQEKARVRIAYVLLAMLGLAVVCVLATGSYLALTCYAGKTCGEAKEAFALLSGTVALIFTPVVGLVGSAIGFYFGSKSAGG